MSATLARISALFLVHWLLNPINLPAPSNPLSNYIKWCALLKATPISNNSIDQDLFSPPNSRCASETRNSRRMLARAKSPHTPRGRNNSLSGAHLTYGRWGLSCSLLWEEVSVPVCLVDGLCYNNSLQCCSSLCESCFYRSSPRERTQRDSWPDGFEKKGHGPQPIVQHAPLTYVLSILVYAPKLLDTLIHRGRQ